MFVFNPATQHLNKQNTQSKSPAICLHIVQSDYVVISSLGSIGSELKMCKGSYFLSIGQKMLSFLYFAALFGEEVVVMLFWCGAGRFAF